jgi:putative lipoic acid-binding regulatory protein
MPAVQKRTCFLCMLFPGILGLVSFDAVHLQNRNFHPLHQQSDDASDDDSSAPVPPVVETSAELPERFNYKVQALMGNFDPVGVDDERQDGNILNAMINFPARYTFHVVGKTCGDDGLQQAYIENVQRIVQGTTGDEDITCESVPRGTKFTKVQCEASVQSATMINNIYDELDKLELTVMRF